MIEFQTEKDRLLLAVMSELLDRADLSPERLIAECGSDPYRAADKVALGVFSAAFRRETRRRLEEPFKAVGSRLLDDK